MIILNILEKVGPFESYLLHGQVKEMCSHIIIYCLTSQASHDGVSKQAASQIFFRSKPRSFAIGSLELCLQAWATQIISDPTWQVTQKILKVMPSAVPKLRIPAVPALKESLQLLSLEKSKSCPKTTESITDFSSGALNFSLSERMMPRWAQLGAPLDF